MKSTRFTETQIVKALKEHEADERRAFYEQMKLLFFILLFLPCAGFAQKYNFGGEYRNTDFPGSRQGLKITDSTIESFSFKDDSVKIGYLVAPRHGYKPVSKYRGKYVKWNITRQAKSYETDTGSGKEIVYERLDVALNDGKTIGYFQYASSTDEEVRKTLPQGLIFMHNGRRFLKVGDAR